MNINLELDAGVQGSHGWTGTGVAPPTGAGIVVFSASMKLVHINRQAAQWLQLGGFAGRRDRRDIGERLPLSDAVIDLFEDLLLIVRSRTETEDWRQIEIAGLITGPSHRLLLRGFGIPDKRGIAEARIVMTVEAAHVDREALSVSWAGAGPDVV